MSWLLVLVTYLSGSATAKFSKRKITNKKQVQKED